jgi:hypothetical protein
MLVKRKDMIFNLLFSLNYEVGLKLRMTVHAALMYKLRRSIDRTVFYSVEF